MSTNNKLFEKMLNYVINVELFLKHMLFTIYNKQLTLRHFRVLGVPNKKMKKGYVQKKEKKIFL